ncbi:O-antigen ligase [Plantactinospora sp. KBS50]|uniref:O-antigen ligase family protein n=1 Tax=Plantactinospora sp. KBS50 TaxID=2024580 RepID=UPI0012FE05F1|nr:O-antigen ligase family protein [Plantactinospora sp. KBS50]
MATVGALLVHVLFETWAQVLTGPTSTDPRVNLENAAQWPKLLKSCLYVVLALLTVAKVALERQWRRFGTPADLALLVLGLVMVLAGLVNDSSLTLMGQALFVYFRGVLVFYALRVADLNSSTVRRLLSVVAVVVALNIAVALVQMFVGTPAYQAVGWVDLAWAGQHRAQGLLPHPNHLGHVLGLALLGIMSWAVATDSPRRTWWVAATLVTLGLSATQSRESLLGVLVAGVIVAMLVRSGARRALGICLLLLVCTAVQIAARPENRAEWERRFDNAFSGIYHPAGSERIGPSPSIHPTPGSSAASVPSASPTPPVSRTVQTPKPASADRSGATERPASPGEPAAVPSATPVREIRVLYLQQAARILPRQPLLGFGIGQFGGVVAEKNNPRWNENPKFGPRGFNRYGFQAVQIDSFWLHLVMEAGVLGLAAFLVWLLMVVRPLLRPTRAALRQGSLPPPTATLTWGIAAVVFAVVVAFLSPSFEDPLLPPLLWTVVGLAWSALRRWSEAEAAVDAAEPERTSP